MEERVLALFIVGLFVLPLGSASIGIEREGDLLHTWNRGGIMPDTYFNISSGLLQHANLPDRLSDVTMSYGVARNNSGTWVFWGLSSYPANVAWQTDNVSYWRAWSWDSVHQGAARFDFSKYHWQGLYDDYVHINLSFVSNRRVTGQNYWGIVFEDMDVSSDGSPDTIIVGGFDVVDSFSTDYAGLREYKDMQTVVFSDVNYSYLVNYSPKNVTMVWQGGDLYVLDYIGTIQRNTEYRLLYDWIDANCIETCPKGCTATPTTNSSGGTFTQGEYHRNVGCRMQGGGLCVGGSCAYSADCRLVWRQNTSTGGMSIIQAAEPDRSLRCDTSPCQTTGAPVTNVWYYEDLRMSKSGGSLFGCSMLVTGGSPYESSPNVSYTVNRGSVNLTLSAPPNMTNSTQGWQVFVANQTNLTPLDNITLYFNSTANFTQSGATNMSTNVSFDGYFISNWTAYGCYAHTCNFAWNGNWTVINSLPIISQVFVSARRMVSYFIDRTSIYARWM